MHVNIIFNKIYSDEENYKYFIGYLYDEYKIMPWYIMLPKSTAYLKCNYGPIKWMYFLIEGDDLLEKYYTIWDKVSA